MTLSRVFMLVAFMGLAACGTVSDTQDTVIGRSDELSKRPEWVKESDAFYIANGMVYSMGNATISADSRVEAGYRIAENNAKGAIAGAIEQKLSFVFQNAEEGSGMDSTQARFIGAEASKLTASSIRLGKRYWEKVVSIGNDGQKAVQYRVFAQVTMPEEAFKKAIADAIRRSAGKTGLSQEFAKKVDENWEEIVKAP